MNMKNIYFVPFYQDDIVKKTKFPDWKTVTDTGYDRRSVKGEADSAGIV